MRLNYTDITIVLDRSGSMESVKSDTIGGFNSFLRTQKAVSGKATLSLAQFDNIYEKVYEGRDIAEIPELTQETFIPRGSTALLDAIGRTINETGKRLASMPEAERPEKIVFVILTDGYENASHEFTAEQINTMIQHQRDNYKWEFVFLGANQDAITTAATLGIQTQNAMTYAANTIGVQAVFSSVGRNLVSYRSGSAEDMRFRQDDREEQKKAGVK